MPNLLRVFLNVLVAAFVALSAYALVTGDLASDPISECGTACANAAQTSTKGDPR